MSGRVDAPKPAGPPPVRVFLHPSGRVEVLKPVVRSKDFAERPAAIAAPSGEAILASWGRRSLAVACAFAVLVLVFAAGILIGSYYPHVEPLGSQADVVQQSENLAAPAKADLTDSSISTDSPLISDAPTVLRSVINRGPAKLRVLRAVYRPRRTARPPQITFTGFVPTTLVIYAVNGEIKTRIEPQLSSN
jgi:hypothetical protein